MAMKNHAQLAKKFLANEERTDWHNKTILNFRNKRDIAVKQIPEWEELRSLGSQIKDYVLANLDDLLIEFEQNAQRNGIQVHWAQDAQEHNSIVYKILKENQARKIVKSKSMLTEECQLNEFLEAQDIEVIDTDLGERIIQLKDEPPSHIVAPAVHLKREDVGVLFAEKLDTEPGNHDPTYLTRAARKHLRDKFLGADAGITGVNFAIADTGGVAVVTNEGNADMGVHLPNIQIHSMGIEKIIPKWIHLGVFTRLLSTSATGQKLSIYTSHYLKPKPGGQMHIILVDNGRSEHLGMQNYRNSMKCIRCSACFNTCPVYRRTGGHSYHTTVAGPIGSILNPTRNRTEFADLPFASSLCGSCSDVCPVKINIHEQLYIWRQEIGQKGPMSSIKKRILKVGTGVLSNPKRMQKAGKFYRTMQKILPSSIWYNQLNGWGKGRQMPQAAKQSFEEWYRKNRS